MLTNTTQFAHLRTPFYYYDTELLARTLDAIRHEIKGKANHHIHYAIKANANPLILKQIAAAGFGADCVSGGEIEVAIQAGFPVESIVYAGVGKADWEIELALQAGIGMFNVESIAELQVIHEIAQRTHRHARVSFRINPDVGAHTHAHITTGLAENKFGIAREDMVSVVRMAQSLEGIQPVGLHFHIGSQILEMDDFQSLAVRINELQDELEAAGLSLENINVGGGLGIDYEQPDAHPIADFAAYFRTYDEHLCLRPGQQLHFELGRSVVAQMGSLISRVLYVKEGKQKKFAISDAGFTELIRPAFYGAFHLVQNMSAMEEKRTGTAVYDVVGPICESSDVFLTDYQMPMTRRGDFLVFRSAGAYGETMSSNYNCRPLPKAYTREGLQNPLSNNEG